MSIAVIGPVTKDMIVIGKNKKEQIGGTAFYSGIALANLGIKTKIFTKLSVKDKSLLSNMKHKNIELFPYFCKSTTCFRNIYLGDERQQFVDSISAPFSVKDVKGAGNCRFVHLGPLTKGDIPLSVIKYLKSLGLTISLDVQGYLRRIRNKKISLMKWKDKEKFLKYVDILKADKKEAKVLTGKDERLAAMTLAAMGPAEAIITDGEHGSLIYSQNRYYRIPAFSPGVTKDVTGCGDTYMAAYLAKRMQSSDLKECGLFAARCATAKIERGVFNASEKDVGDRLIP